MLVVAGALVASLTAFQDKAGAEPMLSSWYGPGLEGNLTASGEVFDPYDYTAAHPTLPMGTRLQVCYAECTVVRVNDRGPYAPGRDLDLSQAAAEDIGLTAVGADVVEVEVLGQQPAPRVERAPARRGNAKQEPAKRKLAKRDPNCERVARGPLPLSEPQKDVLSKRPCLVAEGAGI